MLALYGISRTAGWVLRDVPQWVGMSLFTRSRHEIPAATVFRVYFGLKKRRGVVWCVRLPVSGPRTFVEHDGQCAAEIKHYDDLRGEGA